MNLLYLFLLVLVAAVIVTTIVIICQRNTIKELNQDLDHRVNDLNTALKVIEETESQRVAIVDSIPDKFKDNLDLNNYAHFRSCYMKLQNEAFKAGIIKVTDSGNVCIIAEK